MAKLAAWFGMQGIIEHHQEAQGVVIDVCYPGMCPTNMQHDFPLLHRLIMKVSLLPLGRTGE
ncbi:hypothetical protein PG989_013637 [Apiospora arundinis]